MARYVILKSIWGKYFLNNSSIGPVEWKSVDGKEGAKYYKSIPAAISAKRNLIQQSKRKGIK